MVVLLYTYAQTIDNPQVVVQLGHSEWITSIAVFPDCKLRVSGSGDTTVRLWDVTSGQCTKTFAGHSDKVHPATFSPDGATVVSGSADTTIKFWNIHTYQPIKTIHAHTYVILLAVS